MLRPTKQRRVVATLELAERFQAMLAGGEVKRRSELATRFAITRARVTQVLALNRLEPSIRAHALAHPRVSERALRPLLLLGPADQLTAASKIVPGWPRSKSR
jgi:hypothetical protein